MCVTHFLRTSTADGDLPIRGRRFIVVRLERASDYVKFHTGELLTFLAICHNIYINKQIEIVREKTCCTFFRPTRRFSKILTQSTHKHFCINKTSNVIQNLQIIKKNNKQMHYFI